jgi:hypothetical protein
LSPEGAVLTLGIGHELALVVSRLGGLATSGAHSFSSTACGDTLRLDAWTIAKVSSENARSLAASSI